MYVVVQLLAGYQTPLTYRIPAHLALPQPLVGSVVRVPIQQRSASALIIGTRTQAPQEAFTIRDIEGFEPFPTDRTYQTFIERLSTYHQVTPLHFIKRIRQFVHQKEVAPETTVADAPEQPDQHSAVTLTAEQEAVCTFMRPHILEPCYTPALLHGVTGSGKTEVYKNLITAALAAGKSVLLLLPEVTLALQFERLLKAQLPHTPFRSFHSATSAARKKALWRELLAGTPICIIGVHLPVLLPIANLGLIIVDEEHEAGYQEKKHPKVMTRDAAVWRAHVAGIPILLGSATPSISSLYNAKKHGWHFFALTQRFAGSFPVMERVMLTEDKGRRSFWITRPLEKAIEHTLAKGEQVLIYLNRRGYSFFVQCGECTLVFSCSNCSVSLTLHQDDHLRCHYCDFEMRTPATCPGCNKPDKCFIKKGVGTQQMVPILEKLFPRARIGRADLDMTKNKKEWQTTLTAFEQGELDILVGTQTITKGFHFPRVTLVGIIWADLNLNFPIFNASETTLQQLIQVGGRAGRSSPHSRVIVQTMVDHPIFEYLNETDYPAFYAQEIGHRTELGYPPAQRLIEIELKHDNELLLEKEARGLAEFLREQAAAHGYVLRLLGPAKPLVAKVKNTHARKIYIKTSSMQEVITLFASVPRHKYFSAIFFVPNPTS